MAASAGPDTAIRYEDETGAVTLTTAAQLDLKRAARALPEWRRQHAGRPAGPVVADARGWTWGAGHVPHERLVDLDRLWVAAFDPVERWMVARPMRGVNLGSVRRMLTEPIVGPRELGAAPAASRPEPGIRSGEVARAVETVRSHACLGASLVGSLIHATAGGFGVVGRKLLNRSVWAW